MTELALHFQGKPFTIRVIQVYVPTSNAEDAEIAWFYEDQQDVLELRHKKDVLFTIGDWNAKAGSQEIPGVTGKFGFGIQNETGHRLTEFCQENTLVIENNLFQQHKRRLYTWTSPDGQYQNQIDYILYSQWWRSSIQSAKTAAGHDWGSNHELLIVTFRRKLKKVGKTTRPFSLVQSLSRVRLFATPRIAAHQASLSITNFRSLLKLMSIKSVMPSSHLILCHPLLLLPSIFHRIRVFSNESTLRMKWPNYWSFSFSISPSNEHPGLISFRMNWLDLLAVQETLKSLLQHHSSKASIPYRSAFFTAQLSHPYMTTGKTIALTRRTLVGKVMSLLFNMLSKLVITFLPRSKCLLISWLQSPSTVILEPKEIVWHCFHCFPIYLPWSNGTRCHDHSFLNVEP